MNHADFVHLHNHSDYSLLDGASPIPRMVERAAEMRMPALALTDHGSLFGAVEFYQEARRAGVKPIVGMEAYVTRGNRRERTRDTAHHLVLLARDEQGFRNLMRLSSFAFLEGFYYKPRVDHALLAQHAAGLLALSACPKGEVASDLVDDNEERAAQTALMYRDMFGAENYFLEVQNHGLEIEDKIRERIASLARRSGIPRVATNDCHYLRHEDADAHDVLLCIQTGKTVDDAKRMQMNTDQLFFRSPEEMKAAFDGDPEVIHNTLAVAERCNLQLSFGRPLLPEFPLPPGAADAEDYLRTLARTELSRRFPGGGAAYASRLEYELDVICRMGFASYFLIVRDFIAYARERGIAVGPGRGSVAGSLVAYVLRVTDIDPIQHGLIFERFLNPERVSMPDIDIDFDDLRRGEVIEYVKRKYGDGNVTQIITFGTMGAKGVVRDVGRALGMAFAEVDRIAKLVPDGLNMTLERALELSPDLKNLPQRGGPYARLLKSARALEGLARHASTHAAGVLITPGPLLDYVPLYRQKDESITTQWDMKAVEKAGLLKMDFLGLRTLSVLQQAVGRIAEQGGPALDLLALPMDDATAYEVFQRADTVGIFQFESSGMRDYLRQLKPSVFEDLVAMNALYRPGPMEHIPFFIDCKHGRQVARYEHPDLEPILHGTYGVFVYQEQVMQAANVLAGFSMAQADELRRAMGKKKPEEMEAKRAQFVEGCRKKRIPAAKAEKIFATMEKFAGYGFNRSHSAAYALLAYQTAYLKSHYPAEFMAATLTSEMSDSARIVTLIEECRRMRLPLLPPDVNRSEWRFTLEGGSIRFGLGAVRNVGQSAVDAIVAARAREGAFRDLFDLAQRVDARAINRRVLESLIAAGACDGLGPERGAMHAGAGRTLEHAEALKRERQSGQSSLFGEGSDVAVVAPPLPDGPPWGASDRSAREKEVLGFYFSEHPLEPLRETLAKLVTHSIAEVLELEDGAEVRVGAVVIDVKRLTTRAGKPMASVTLEDLSGRIESTVFPDTWEATRALLEEDHVVVVTGRVEVREDREVRLLLAEARSLEQARGEYRPCLHIEIRSEDLSVGWYEEVDRELSGFPGDADVYLHIVMPDHSRMAMRSKRYRVAENGGVVAALRERFPFVRVGWGKGMA
ncbi:MAG: DNA polymerase III subunit alpha [Candidatus Eisenbacteria bacterium]|uniref:DNA polymerase III subunit alpha n=1 Tax=Eiseniibacteriota bacterium TaxID=2212470 RepID=A0A538SFM6_UNCEI|nr:MAG: DNA polymerase III subunit alpha [Candidatus Eisenbacteria bacterium]